jgi:hypothetical protein
MKQMLVITVEELYEKLFTDEGITVDDVDAVFFGYSHKTLVIVTKCSVESDLADFSEFPVSVKVLTNILKLIESGDLPEQFVIERTICSDD